MTVQTRDYVVRDRDYRWDYSPCYTPPNKTVVGGTMVSIEQVESYRGKAQFVEVGNDKRRAFNDFYRFKWALSKGSVMHWCPGAASLAAEDYPILPLSWYCNGYTVGMSGEYPPMGKTAMLEFQESYMEIVKRDLAIKANSPRFDGYVFLAELSELLQGIWKLFKGVVQGLYAPSTKKRDLIHIILNPEELWLWVRYALVPAMLDAEDMMRAFDVQRQIDRVQDGGRIKSTLLTGEAFQFWNAPFYANLPMKWECTVKGGYGGAYDILHRYDPHEWGNSAHDIIRAAWERIPFSFIFDWFINVGAWLESLRSLELILAQSYATVAYESTTICVPGAAQQIDASPVCKCFLMTRTTHTEPPRLPLVDREWANCLRTVDLIALTAGILKSILSKNRRNL